MPPPAKRRRIAPTPKLKGPRPEEINFDLDARQDYLTGFHKRKVQRTKAAQEAAERRAKEEKRLQRQKIRQERKEELAERVKIVDAYMKPPSHSRSDGEAEDSVSESDSGDDEDEGAAEPVVVEKVDHKAEYVDEDKYTSVVVEEVGVDRDGFVEAQDSEPDGDDKADQTGPSPVTNGTDTQGQTKRKWTHEKPKHAAAKAKTKRKKFRYESKAERKVERGKQRAKNSKQAKARREQ